MFIVIQIVVFIAVLLIFYSLYNLVVSQTKVGRRLDERSAQESEQAQPQSLALDDSILKKYEKYLTPDDQKKLNELRKALIRSGYRSPSSVRKFNAYRLLSSVIALILGAIIFPLLMQDAPAYMIITIMVITLLLGFFGPRMWLERNYQYRSMAVQEGFPDALDLILVCIEAGHGFDQALNRVVKELEKANPVLAEEFQVVVRELRVGKDRYNVLENFAWRTGVDDIAAFITVIKQADKFGVSIADALRVYSNEMREKRYMRAEEKANLMPVKMALGAIMFTVPPAMLVMAGPSIIMVVRQLAGVGT